ncbi:MAG: LysR family transcriptional regulator, partial [Ruminococcus sp.]|nr:LysR family transcriptional regulator [Ruminococcus sp.]
MKAVSGVLLSPFALKAAEMLNYSQSGISRMISDIEEDWKVTLLERGKSGVRLTSDGTRILPYVRNICEGYEKLQMQIDDINGLQSGFIRIGTFSSVATHWLPEIIKKFQINYPDIEYEL